MKAQLVLFLFVLTTGQATTPPEVAPVFAANHGQAPPAVRFMAKGSGVTALFTPEAVILRLAGQTIEAHFEGAPANGRIEGRDALPGRANFLVGAEEEWRVNLPTYAGVAYRDLYPGIEMTYGGDGRRLKSEFVVHPGAEPSRIRIRYVGCGRPRTEAGALIVPVRTGALREEPPVAYQESESGRAYVDSRFVVNEDGTVGFAIGEHDPATALVIDPVLAYSTLLGGSGLDAATGVAVDSTGAVYVAGYTDSYDFPTVTSAQSARGAGIEAFVTKFNAAGNPIYSTYIGGSGDDRAYGVTVDTAGVAYLTGYTTSTNFPVRNAAQARLAGGKNAFALKLSGSGNSLLYSTYFGGGSDAGNKIAVDAGGNAYVVGDTTSATLPANGFQRSNRGSQDAFILKLNPTGAIAYCTYLGGNGIDSGAAITVDTSGNAYVTGGTYSTDFPTSAPYHGTNAGGQDAFVAKLNGNGSALVYSTYLGGAGGRVGYPEAGQAIVTDASGNAYVAGATSSTDFPTLFPVQSRLGGWTDAFVAKFSAAGWLSYSTYLGGSGLDTAAGLSVDATGSIIVAGSTYSTDFPTVNAIQGKNAGDYDAFWAVLSTDRLLFSDYLGGAGSDSASAVALSSGALYIAGVTLSTSFPAKNAYQTINGGGCSAFVTKIALDTSTPVSVSPSNGQGFTQTFAFVFSDANGYAALDAVEVLINSQLSTSRACYLYAIPSSNLMFLAGDAGSWLGPIALGSNSTTENSQCRLSAGFSSWSGTGGNLTLIIQITFKAAFGGTKNIYMEAIGKASGQSGWQQRGLWSIPSGTASAVSVTPASGTGTSQTFSFVFQDPAGYGSLGAVEALFGDRLSAATGCYIYVIPSSRMLYLASDTATAWIGTTLGSALLVENSRCRVNAFASGLSGAGDNLLVVLSLYFKPGFTGAKNIYMEAISNASGYSGWEAKGTWTSGGLAAAPVSVSPASGTGTAQTFTFLFTDTNGYGSIGGAETLIHSQLSATAACYLYTIPSTGLVYLANDAATGWIGPVTLGGSGTLQNKQCRLDASGSSVRGSGNDLTLRLALSFQTAFAGSKNVYLEAIDNTAGQSGWQQKGVWAIP